MEENKMLLTLDRKQINYPNVSIQKILQNKPIPPPSEIREYTTIQIPDDYRYSKTANALETLNNILQNWENIKPEGELYTSFKIPKRSGGLRKIDAPVAELKCTQSQLAEWLQFKASGRAHDAAYAYVKGRSHIKSLQRHQANKSNWFLKIDFKNFFPSHNKAYILNMLEQVYPVGVLIRTDRDAISKMLDICLLNDSLPQGTPISPALTNLCTVPIDYDITNLCVELGKKYGTFFTYTRYADDIIISARKSFKWSDVIKEINNILKKHNAPFKINKEKTRYGSRAGRNWNVGLMLNKDNQITLGHHNNKALKTRINNFCYENLVEGATWTKPEVQEFQGYLAYAKAVEPDYIAYLLNKYSEKYNTNIERVLKDMLTT
jgi:hypothetical protein